jgi:hypothetical protein
MQRVVQVLFVFILLGTVGCSRRTSAVASPPTIPPSAVAVTDTTQPATDPATLPAIPTDTLAPTDTALPPTEPPSPIPPSPTFAPEPTSADELSISPADVILHPVPFIYAGDKVTFQLLPNVPTALDIRDVVAVISIDGQEVARGPLDRRNWTGQAEGIYEWAWDTTNLSGDYEIEVTLDPDGNIQAYDLDPDNNTAVLTTTVQVVAGRVARTEAAATWETTETHCCVVHMVSNTAAARDLDQLIPILEGAVEQATSRLGEQPSHKLQVYFIDRIVGQGGFAGTDMVVSYVDRRYAGGGLHELLVHEAVHIIDQQFAPRRISFLAEGLAVWASDGHYKAEDITERSAALLQLGRYIPLAQLTNDFYQVQHEVGYLEAAGFVTFLIERAGWNVFKNFYSDVNVGDGMTPAEALDMNLQRYFGASLADLEAEWLAALQRNPPSPQAVADLATTVRYYDVVRHYQAAYDPTAHFLSAWLPHPQQVREFGNPADLTRRPREEINITLEVMLTVADTALRVGDYPRANVILDSIQNILDSGGVVIDPMATSYLKIVQAAAEYGYELHTVDLDGRAARAMATQAPNNRLTSLVMEQRGQDWVILSH